MTHHHPPTAGVPLLLPSLRSALFVLYGPSSGGVEPNSHPSPDGKEAHDFLVDFQGRNVRRKVLSFRQRRRDLGSHHDDEEGDDDVVRENDGSGVLDSTRGSVWLACAHLLCDPRATSAERSFASQTLLHRSRRFKLVESIDSEAEEIGLGGPSVSAAAVPASPEEAVSSIRSFGERLGSYHPLLARCLSQYALPTPLAAGLDASALEGRCKGEIAVLTIPALAYLRGYDDDVVDGHGGSSSSGDGPVLSALGSALAVAALRVRYAPPPLSGAGAGARDGGALLPPPTIAAPAAPDDHPLVSIVARSVEATVSSAAALHRARRRSSDDGGGAWRSRHVAASNRLLCASLASIPDAILGSPGGARGRLSVDPRSIRAANEELRDPETGVRLLLRALLASSSSSSSSGDDDDATSGGRSAVVAESHGRVLVACERWGRFVPLPPDFVEKTAPLAASYVRSYDGGNNNDAANGPVRKAALLYLMSIFESANVDPEKALAASVGLVSSASDDPRSGGHHQTGRRKPTSKSKRRARERLADAVRDDGDRIQAEAIAECDLRGEAAILAASLSFQPLRDEAYRVLDSLPGDYDDGAGRPDEGGVSSDDDDDLAAGVDGEGPLGCLASCCAACLPRLVRRERTERRGRGATTPPTDVETFNTIGDTSKRMCSSRNRRVRSLARESMFAVRAELTRSNANANAAATTGNRDDAGGGGGGRGAGGGEDDGGGGGGPVADAAIEYLYECTMLLASSCRYPPGYFDDLSADSDEGLENERNDVRDVVRAVTALESERRPPAASMRILRRLVEACADSVRAAGAAAPPSDGLDLPPETAVHALSALAKPLNCLADAHARGGAGAGAGAGAGGGVWSADDRTGSIAILVSALNALADTSDRLVAALSAPGISDPRRVMPVSRLANLATASLSPLFESISRAAAEAEAAAATAGSAVPPLEEALRTSFRRALRSSVRASALSLSRIPELTSPSTLADGSPYDVRGAMRGPGGEDHVGCLSLRRLACEGDASARAILAVYSEDDDHRRRGPYSIVSDLADLHDELKRIELRRGPGIDHGEGVAPKSRRILLETVSRLGLVAMGAATTDGGVWTGAAAPGAEAAAAAATARESIRSKLEGLFRSPLDVALRTAAPSSSRGAARPPADDDEAERVHRICEATFDLASFPSDFTATLFVGGGGVGPARALEGVRAIVDCCARGYGRVATEDGTRRSSPDPSTVQWGRLRGAVLYLFRSALNGPDMPPLAAEAIVALNDAEMAAVRAQCDAGLGPNAGSSIFCDGVVGPDGLLPAGAYVMVCGEALERARKASAATTGEVVGQLPRQFRGSVAARALCASKDSVLGAIAHPCPDPDAFGSGTWTDPRPTISEAWYLSLISFLEMCGDRNGEPGAVEALDDPSVKQTVAESTSAAILLFLFSRLDKENKKRNGSAAAPQSGMSMDGPHTFAIMNFLQSALSVMGPDLLPVVGTQLHSKLDVDQTWMDHELASPGTFGAAMLGAALFRASSGGLPPWAVECVPGVYSALYAACGESPDSFCNILGLSSLVRLSSASRGFGGIRPGGKLAGRYFETMSEKARTTFLNQSREVCLKNNRDGWRRFKVILKAACGGKKKARGFNLKPAFTSWDCERI